MLGNCMEQRRNNWIRLFMAIPCFWFSCYFVSGRGTKAWLDVLVTDSAWFMFRWCRDCTGILQSPSFFCNHKAIQKNTHQLHINTKHHFVSLVLFTEPRFERFKTMARIAQWFHCTEAPANVEPKVQRVLSKVWATPKMATLSGLEVAGSNRLCLDFV